MEATEHSEPGQPLGLALTEGLGLVPKRATLRWKKHKRPTGLAAVGAGPQGSTLHDGTTEYASVYPLGGDWRRPLQGWYWTCGARECGEYRNTCNEPAPDEQTAKAQAMRFVKAAIAKRA